MKEIILLTDYRGQFYYSTKHRGASVDLKSLVGHFNDLGFSLKIKTFSEVDFRNESYKDKYVMYQSSEDPDLKYKGYIQDIVMGLHMQGAILIPNIYYFRAHHNKVFMEILRDEICSDIAGNIKSKYYGTYEDYKNDANLYKDGVYVLKPEFGTRSKGVRLLRTLRQKISYPLKASKTFTSHNIKWAISKFFTGKPYIRQSNNRRKFIVQNFIEGLSGDYRVSVYGDKHYVLYRKNRKDDFRASGSGNIEFDVEMPNGLLDYAKKVYERFNTPYISLDIGFIRGEFFLFEFQFMCLGQYVIEKSKWYYCLENGIWEKKVEEPDLEKEIASSVANFLNHK